MLMLLGMWYRATKGTVKCVGGWMGGWVVFVYWGVTLLWNLSLTSPTGGIHGLKFQQFPPEKRWTRHFVSVQCLNAF